MASSQSMSRARIDVDEPAEVARRQADHGADDDREHGGDDADDERDPGAVGDAHQHVTAEVVGAEQERGRRADRLPVRGERRSVRELLVGAVAGDARR